jgi:adenylylsulfate kinase
MPKLIRIQQCPRHPAACIRLSLDPWDASSWASSHNTLASVYSKSFTLSQSWYDPSTIRTLLPELCRHPLFGRQFMKPMSDQAMQGHVFWLFGLSGAGKSTLSSRLAADLRSQGVPVLTLDGDVLRSGLCQGVGFSDEERTENLRRAAETAKLGCDSGLQVVASFITPLARHRELIRTIIGPKRLSLIYVTAPLAICQQRDVKGLYAKAASGKLAQMTGVSSSFNVPDRSDLVIETAIEPVGTSAARLLEFACTRLTATF